MTPVELAVLIRSRAAGRGRFITALAGAPGSGKSTLAQTLVAALGAGARVVPMDGFHYDDAVLEARGHRARKGAPYTFDAQGFIHLMHRLRAGGDVAIPVFDRSMELSRAAADVVTDADQFLVVEGNYLLLDQAPWTDLAPLFDLTVFLDVPLAELDRRLVARWAHYGKTPDQARAWIDGNDMLNIRQVVEGSRAADVVVRWQAGVGSAARDSTG
ncbi:MAG: nucleoside triphosphate hydrolase [Rhodobacteraceae bacterium]|jgi:pantothenate kinase|nr:nucleoside triphosphate hydrolase [Paracoccaceae bacterium]